MGKKINEKDAINFLLDNLGGSHLSGFAYAAHVIATQSFNNLYGKTSQDYKINYKHIERSIRYYFYYVENKLGKEKFRELLNLEPEIKLSNKNIISQITLMLS